MAPVRCRYWSLGRQPGPWHPSRAIGRGQRSRDPPRRPEVSAHEPGPAVYYELTKETHDLMRAAVADLDPAALAWRPAPETSSIAVLVVHTLGSELEVLRCVRGLPSDRVRDEEFVDHETTAADLLARLDRATALLDEHIPQITEADLTSMRDRPQPPAPARLVLVDPQPRPRAGAPGPHRVDEATLPPGPGSRCVARRALRRNRPQVTATAYDRRHGTEKPSSPTMSSINQ